MLYLRYSSSLCIASTQLIIAIYSFDPLSKCFEHNLCDNLSIFSTICPRGSLIIYLSFLAEQGARSIWQEIRILIPYALLHSAKGETYKELGKRTIVKSQTRKECTLIRIRIDVDYPYPSRIRSFMCTALNLKAGGDYLKNSKIVARMINESRREVKACWFFTPKTIPDEELLTLIDNRKHEVALHVVNDPVGELRLLEEKTGKKIKYYTIHGTARLLARVMWKRWRSKAPKIPSDFPLQSFHQFPTTGIDSLCYVYPPEKALRFAEERIRAGDVLYFHPIWLFQRGTINHRGPFYDALRRILEDEKGN